MSDMFRSALNYISTAAANAPSVGGTKGSDHDMVGQTVEIGGLKLRIRYLIAEGGFGLVFAVTDTTNRWYALKRMLAADREQSESILHEIRVLRQVTGHPCIIQYIQAANLSPQESGHGRAEFLVLTELCSGGQIVQALIRKPFTPDEVCKVMNAACQAIKHMHSMDPPIIHRDMKVENLLLDPKGFVKLCDFGSATTEVHDVNPRWTAAQRSNVVDELSRFTTPMYRAPEMLDLYLNHRIGAQLDVWALGCILYYMCYRRHPFEDSATLRIVNANYTLPDEEEAPTPFSVFHPVIRSCLAVDPNERPSIDDLCERVTVIAIALDVDLAKPAASLLAPDHKPVTTPHSGGVAEPHKSAAPAPHRPPPPRPTAAPSDQSATASTFSALSGRAGSLFSKMKDSGSKMVHQVQQTVTGKGPDMTYVTSRLVLCALPESLPDALWTPAEDQLMHVLDAKHPNTHAVYNLGERKMRHTYGGRLSEVQLPTHGRAPSLHAIFTICDNMSGWLRVDENNVCIVCGLEEQCAAIITAMLLYTRIVNDVPSALRLLHGRHGHSLHLSMAVLRYLHYTHDICTQHATLNSRSLTMTGVLLSNVPCFNKARSGCRPFIDIVCGGQRVFTSAQDYERMSVYDSTQHTSVELTCGVIVNGDVTISIFHARETLGAKVGATAEKYARLPILRAQYHTAFVDGERDCGELHFTLHDLDDTDDAQKYGREFKLTLMYRVGEEAQFTNELPPYWQYDKESVGPRLAVRDKKEMDEIKQMLAMTDDAPAPPPPPRHRANEAPPPADQPKSQFFTSLQWDGKTDDSNLAPVAPPPIPSRSPNRSPALPRRVELTEEDHERAAGIRVSAPDVPEDEPWNRNDAAPTTASNGDVDLLNLSAGSTKPSSDAFNPFAQFETPAVAQPNIFADFNTEFTASPNDTTKDDGPDLLQDWTSAVLNTQSSSSNRASPQLQQPFGTHLNAQPMPRNVSAPQIRSDNSVPAHKSGGFADSLLDDILAQPDTATSSNGSTPSHQPNYSRTNFAPPAPSTYGVNVKPKVDNFAFEDILSSTGFASSAPKMMSDTSMAGMRRAEENVNLTENEIRVRDWTNGKERNIRALLSSLHNVLWEGAQAKWSPCSMGDLLTATQVKKMYMKACLVVHPDKQMGTPHQDLAKALFGELNDAWGEFKKTGSPSM